MLHSLTAWDGWCSLYLGHPLLTANLLFFLNVDVGFWVAGLMQRSTWLIDPYWTLLPPLIHALYATHPQAAGHGTARANALTLLIWCWSARLTHSYFRRERWQFGAREDWRFSDMAQRCGRHWWWLSFFVAYVSQHAMLMGLTLPVAAVELHASPWRPLLDSLAAAMCVAGVLTAAAADTQLHAFVAGNERRVQRGEKPRLLLDTGLWSYSRHPNYFGELLWWWGVGAFGAAAGQPWTLGGAAFNTLCMVPVTCMVEDRMLRRGDRRAAYTAYQATTPVWLPWPPARAKLA